MADKAHLKTDKELLKMERHLSAIYSRTGKELETKAAEFFSQFKQADEAKKGLVKAGQLSEEEYARWRRTQIMTGERWKRLQEQTAQELLDANRTAQAYINGKLADVYALNYNAAGSAISDAVRGYSFELVDASTVKNLATSDKTLLPYKYVDGKKDIRWNTQKINSEVLQGILQGESMDKIAARFRTEIPEMDKVSAIRNARTSVTGAENKGRMDSYKEAQDKGVKMVRVWMSAHDRRVRPEHLELDKQEAALDEPFVNSIGEIMYPGDPNADPANVYNCRCSLRTRIIGFKKAGEQEKEPKKTQEIVEVQDQATKFVPAQTIEEAEQYISQYVDKSIFGAVGVDYSGISLDMANEINRTISELQNTFDVGKFGGIIAPAGNTKAGKLIEGATAAYSPVRQSYYLNRKTLKSVNIAEQALANERKAITDILTNPQKYDLSKASARLVRIVENSKISGRATIPTNIEQVLQHEFGHSIEKKIKNNGLWSEALDNMKIFAPQISGYACENMSEYIAESFCSYMQNEGRADPILEKIFDSLKRS